MYQFPAQFLSLRNNVGIGFIKGMNLFLRVIHQLTYTPLFFYSLRLQAAKHLKWFLCNEQNSESKLPAPDDLDIHAIEKAFITKTNQLFDDNNSKSVFTVSSGIMQGEGRGVGWGINT